MKELTAAYGALLQDRRVRAEQSKYENITRQRNSVMLRYRKVYQAFNDLNAGLVKAQRFYSEMKDTVDSLEQNVETFVNNRRLEGAQLLNQIERDRLDGAAGQADRERERLRELMERMSMDPSATSPSKGKAGAPRPPPGSTSPYQTHPYPAAGASRYPGADMAGQYSSAAATSPPPPPHLAQSHMQAGYGAHQGASSSNGPPALPRREPEHSSGLGSNPMHDPYIPSAFARRDPHPGPVSSPPLPQQPYMSSPPLPPRAPSGQYGYAAHEPGGAPAPAPAVSHQYIPSGYVPPPPPPGPPPQQQQHHQQQTFPAGAPYGMGAGVPGGAYAQPLPPPSGGHRRPSQSGDPWAGLNAWR